MRFCVITSVIQEALLISYVTEWLLGKTRIDYIRKGLVLMIGSVMYGVTWYVRCRAGLADHGRHPAKGRGCL